MVATKDQIDILKIPNKLIESGKSEIDAKLSTLKTISKVNVRGLLLNSEVDEKMIVVIETNDR